MGGEDLLAQPLKPPCSPSPGTLLPSLHLRDKERRGLCGLALVNPMNRRWIPRLGRRGQEGALSCPLVASGTEGLGMHAPGC